MIKKFFLLFCSLTIVLFFSGCTTSKQASLIKSKRRFEKYLIPQQSSLSGANVINLSEGPKTNYDMKLGPKSLNFDIKIIDPY